MASSRVIRLRAEAPPKPALGEPCNGCGLCCAVEPCPLGVLVSRRRRGRCRALAWDAAARAYRCGVLAQPRRWLPPLRWLPEACARRWVARRIAAGAGCDAALDATPAPP